MVQATVAILAASIVLPLVTVSTRWPTATRTTPSPAPMPPRADSPARLNESFGRLPLGFEAHGTPGSASATYVARGRGYQLTLTRDGALLALAKSDPSVRPTDGQRTEAASVRMALHGSNSAPAIAGEEALPGTVNFLIGNDPKGWRTNLSTYSKVRYTAIYPGIDLVYYGNQRQLEYDFVVGAGADPNVIRMTFEGSRRMTIDRAGDLVLDAGPEVRIRKPFAYQEQDGQRQEVAAAFVLLDQRRVGFTLGRFDRTRPLVIDPVLQYSTYLGGIGPEGATDIAVDAAGSAYLVGSTISPNFPTVNPFQPVKRDGGLIYEDDLFIAKLDATGSALIYSTYLGGGDRDFGHGIAVGVSGKACVTGSTNSTDFPTANALQPLHAGGIVDAFVTCLDSSGTALVYSTYLGGRGADAANGIALDDAGQACLTGHTSSLDFPTKDPFQPIRMDVERDAFVTKLNATGTALVYSTYLGGDRIESGAGIAVDGAGNAYVTGETHSTNFPTLNPIQANLASVNGGHDAFVSKFSPAGSLLYSTYLGGSSLDDGVGIAVDGIGNAYVTGNTHSPDFPTRNPLQPALASETSNIFISQLTPDGSALAYSTFLGDSTGSRSDGIAIDGSGNAYVAGHSIGDDFPVVDAFQPAIGNATGAGLTDVVVAKLSPSGTSLLYSSYLGSSGRDGAGGIAVDATGNAYVAGGTNSAYFPTVGPIQPELRDTSDAFVAKIADSLNPAITSISPSLGSPDTIVDATITGMNFMAGSTTVTVSGTGVTVDNVTVTSPTTLTARFTVSESAALEAHSVTVATPQGSSNRRTFMVFSSAAGCHVSLPVRLRGTVGALDVQFGIGLSEPSDSNWILGIITYDGTSARIYGVALTTWELPAMDPPVTNWTPLPAEIESRPVVGVINGYFNPELCASNVVLADPPAGARSGAVIPGRAIARLESLTIKDVVMIGKTPR